MGREHVPHSMREKEKLCDLVEATHLSTQHVQLGAERQRALGARRHAPQEEVRWHELLESLHEQLEAGTWHEQRR